MKRFKLASVITLLVSIGFIGYLWATNSTIKNGQPSQTNESDSTFIVNTGIADQTTTYEISPTVTTENLQVFLITGSDDLTTKKYTTLATAMEQKMVTVVETGSVNELSIDNNSDEYVFIHSGDIVKGGKQDRTMAYDVIIPPNTKNVALQSFCVESGRWQSRGDEAVGNFSSTDNMLSSRELKMAAKYDTDQSKVWETVATEQSQLSENVSKKNGYTVNVAANESASSLQLTLESEELQKAKADMENAIVNLLEQHPNAIGFAYAINGEIYGVDIYNNRALFEEIWNKVAESIVIEAISNQTEETFTPATINQVVHFINAVTEKETEGTSRLVNESTDLKVIENEAGNVIFSTIDKDENQWVHKNYMKADTSAKAQSNNQMNNQIYNEALDIEQIQIQR